MDLRLVLREFVPRLPAVAVVTLIAASSSMILTFASPGSSSASSPPSTSRIVLAKYGFSVSLPPGWRRVTLTQSGINSIVRYVDQSNPALGSQMSSPSERAQLRKLQLFAVGPPEDNILPNLSVIVRSPQGLPSGPSFLSQAQPDMQSNLQSEGFTNATTTIVQLPLGGAVKGQYSPPSSPTTTFTQLWISHGLAPLHSHILVAFRGGSDREHMALDSPFFALIAGLIIRVW